MQFLRCGKLFGIFLPLSLGECKIALSMPQMTSLTFESGYPSCHPLKGGEGGEREMVSENWTSALD